MAQIEFENPTQGSRLPFVVEYMELIKVACTMMLGWLLFPESLSKGIKQGAQKFLKDKVENKTLRTFPVWRYLPFESLRRNVYYLRSSKSPGQKAGHWLLTNYARIPIMLMERNEHLPITIISHKAEYEYRGIVPATRQRLSTGVSFDPDLFVRIKLPNRSQCLWPFEIDFSTEPVAAWKEKSFDTIDLTDADMMEEVMENLYETSILYKILRFMYYLGDPDAYGQYQKDGKVAAIQNLWIFPNEGRMHSVCEKLLSYLSRNYIWMTYRQAIEDPRNFWTAPVWYRLIPDAKPFSLLKGNKLVVDRIGKKESK